MSAAPAEVAPAEESAARPTIWGLEPEQLYDRFWAARGVQVVRLGQPSQIVDGAELFLLTEPNSLVLFQIVDLVEMLSWLKPGLVLLRIKSNRSFGYRERVLSDEDDRFVRFERDYLGADDRLARIALTPRSEIARMWQNARSTRSGWRQLRKKVPFGQRTAASVVGHVYNGSDDREVMECLKALVRSWRHPDSTVPRARRAARELFTDGGSGAEAKDRCVGPVWIGAGREVPPGETVVGPAILWDEPSARPALEDVRWQDIEPTPAPGRAGSSRGTERVARKRTPIGKRLFDILFSLVALVLTLPLYPFIALAIVLEDGRPVFFGHRRETRGGGEFYCLKFRSMKRGAELVKAQLKQKNLSDGPQFYMERDPRLTRVGAILRKLQLDELPQFLNVLLGQMSVVGPRPSPHDENQFCPQWREARLSVLPGITGLWQVMRTRREGLDFQEWIRFDLEYVERMSWRLDLWIIWRTVLMLAGGKKS